MKKEMHDSTSSGFKDCFCCSVARQVVDVIIIQRLKQSRTDDKIGPKNQCQLVQMGDVAARGSERTQKASLEVFSLPDTDARTERTY